MGEQKIGENFLRKNIRNLKDNEDKKKELLKIVEDRKELDKITEYMTVKVKFSVTCDSSPYIQNEKSIASRVAQYVNDCIEAMDESMRHWGDHEHIIKPSSIKIYNNTEKEEDEKEQEIISLFDDYYDPVLKNFDIRLFKA